MKWLKCDRRVGRNRVTLWLSLPSSNGFSLIEVLLALAVISTGILALLQLMGPALESLSVTRRASFADSIPATVALAAKEPPWSRILAEDAVVVFFCVRRDERVGLEVSNDRLLTSADLARAREEGVRFEGKLFELRARPVDSADPADRFVKMVEVRPLPPLGLGSELGVISPDRLAELSPAFVFPIKVPRQ